MGSRSNLFSIEQSIKRHRRVHMPLVQEPNNSADSQTEINEEDELIPEEIVKDLTSRVSQERTTEKPQLELATSLRSKIEDYVEEQDHQSAASMESPNESMEEDEYIEEEDSSATQLEYYLMAIDSNSEKDSLFSFDLMTNFAGVSYCHIMAEDGSLVAGL